MNTKNRLSFISFLVFAAMMILLPSFSATAAETAGYTVTPCQEPDCWSCMYAWVYDTDPAGTNVRSGPGTDYDIVKTLPSDRFVLVTITGSVGEWMRIEDPKVSLGTEETQLHLTGWIHGTRLSFKVIGPRPLYVEPDTTSSVVATIPDNTHVTLAGCKEGWKKVRYREFTGWIGPHTISMRETEGEGCTPTAGAYVTDVPLAAVCYADVYVVEPDAKGLAVRSEPSDDAPVVTMLPRHTRVYITRSAGEWMRINTLDGCPGDPIGWTYGHLLAVRAFSTDWADDPIAEWDSSGNALVFAEPITGSAVVTKIPRGTEVTVLGCWKEFLRIRYNGVEGWLPSYSSDPVDPR